MTIGGSIFIIAVGAILYFATSWHLANVDLNTVGLILMIAGAAGLVLGFVLRSMAYRRDPRAPVDRDPRDPGAPRY